MATRTSRARKASTPAVAPATHHLAPGPAAEEGLPPLPVVAGLPPPEPDHEPAIRRPRPAVPRPPTPTPHPPPPRSAADETLAAAVRALSVAPEPEQMAVAADLAAEAVAEYPAGSPARIEDLVVIVVGALRAAGHAVPAHAEAALGAVLSGRALTDDAGRELEAAEVQAQAEQLQRDLAATRDFGDRKRRMTLTKLAEQPLLTYPNRKRRVFSVNGVFFDIPEGLVDVQPMVIEHLVQFDAYEGYAASYRAALKIGDGDGFGHEIKRLDVDHDLHRVLPRIPDLRGLEARGVGRGAVRIS